MKDIFLILGENPIYQVALIFFATYPVLSSITWIITTLIYFERREHHISELEFYKIEERPFVSIVIPAYYEEQDIAYTLKSALSLDYPAYEVLVVDDGSRDKTAQIVSSFMPNPYLIFVRKRLNEGKAMAINDAIPLCRGSIIVVIDADSRVHSDILKFIVPHFVKLPRVAAVTGNPRVTNTDTLLAKVQAIEFSSIVSILRRAQTVWGRILTVSGVVSAFRKSALLDVGLFDPNMATEDIAVSWKLQKKFYDVRYEPRALADMQVPDTLRGLWCQRRRWAKGLAQVLRSSLDVWSDYRCRRLWPVYIEATLSILWAYCLIVLTGFFFGLVLFFRLSPSWSSAYS